MPYELDADTTDASSDEPTREPSDAGGSTTGSGAGSEGDAARHDDGAGDEERSPAEELGDAIGVSIPDEHVGAFVAEAFEDAERDTDWSDVVEAFVGPDARDAWAELRAREQVLEVLDAAARYDERAAALLDDVPLDARADAADDDVAEALRCRRTADQFRDGVAAAYGSGHVGDEALVDAVEASAFDTDLIARRESALETVADVHDVDFRPYGGQLFDAEESPEPEVDHDASETW